MFTYKPLLKLLIEKDMTKTQFRIAVGFGPATLAKISKDEYISMEILDKICTYFNCKIEGIIEYKP